MVNFKLKTSYLIQVNLRFSLVGLSFIGSVYQALEITFHQKICKVLFVAIEMHHVIVAVLYVGLWTLLDINEGIGLLHDSQELRVPL